MKNSFTKTRILLLLLASLLAGPPLLAQNKAISGGSLHSLFLGFDCTDPTRPLATGDNSQGQLGDGTNSNRNSPVPVAGLTGVKAVAAGGSHSLFLQEGGTVWATGDNSQGQLGDGTTTDRNSPVQVSGLTGVKAVATGQFHSLFLKEDGTVWATGDNVLGQLGDGTTTARNSPVQVTGLTGVKAVAAGGLHSLFLKDDGTVWATGYNPNGQLGDGTTTNRNSPVPVPGLTGVKALAAGGFHSLFLKEDGTVWATGLNEFGQLGDGTNTGRSSPVPVAGLTGVEAVAAGGRHSLFLKEGGTVWTTGYNGNGQLGDGTNTDRNSPVQVAGLTGVEAVAAGGYHSLFLQDDGTVRATGANENGQLGDGTTTDRNSPVAVPFGTCGVAPQISCPANITVGNDANQCGAVVNFAATETTGIPASTISYSIPPGSFFPIGTTTVTATATNASGSSLCSFTVTVNDNQPPVITCPADINATATSAAGAAVTYTASVGTDNCPGANTIRIAGLASGSTFPIGTTTVTYEVTDAANNKTQCSFTVTVTGVAPQISCPANISVGNDAGQCGANVTFAATETTGIPASTIAYSIPSGSFFPVGTTTVKATATNASGSSECTFTVTVSDTQKPVIICPADITRMATSFNGAAVTYTAPIGTDNCPGATTTSRIAGPASGSTFPVGTTTLTYEVTDAANNKTQCSFTVTVALPTCGPNNQNVQICYYGVTQCVSEKIARNYIKLGATLGPCNAGNTRIGVKETNAPITLSLRAFPNPVQDAVTVEVMAPAAGMATLQVLDVTGRTRQSRQQQLSEGSNEVELRLGSLPTGIYLIRAIDALGHQAVVRVNKQ